MKKNRVDLGMCNKQGYNNSGEGYRREENCLDYAPGINTEMKVVRRVWRWNTFSCHHWGTRSGYKYRPSNWNGKADVMNPRIMMRTHLDHHGTQANIPPLTRGGYKHIMADHKCSQSCIHSAKTEHLGIIFMARHINKSNLNWFLLLMRKDYKQASTSRRHRQR